MGGRVVDLPQGQGVTSKSVILTRRGVRVETEALSYPCGTGSRKVVVFVLTPHTSIDNPPDHNPLIKPLVSSSQQP